MALGANTKDVVWLVLRQGMLLCVLGVGIGGAVSFSASRQLAPILFAVSPYDPSVYVSVAGVILSVAAIATVVPARRAATVDPVAALRSD